MDFTQRYAGANSIDLKALKAEIAAIVEPLDSRSEMMEKLHDFAKTNSTTISQSAANSISLLAEVLWMAIDLDDSRNPFKPCAKLSNGAQTLSAEYLEAEHISMIEAALEFDIKNHEWVSRIADVLWVLKKERDKAKLAFDSYLEIAKNKCDEENFYKTRPEIATERAIQLHLLLSFGEPSRNLITKIIESKLPLDDPDSKNINYSLVEWLDLYSDIASQQEREAIIPKIEPFVTSSEKVKDWRKARRYVQILITLSLRIKDENLRSRFLQKEVELYINEADHGRSIGMAAMSLQGLYTKAITACGNAKGRKQDRIRLLDELLELQLNIPGELKLISDHQDISGEIEVFKDDIADMSALEAISYLSTMAAAQKKETLFKSALDQIGANPIHAMFGTALLDEKGKILSKISSIDLNKIEQDKILQNAQLRAYVANQMRINFSIRGGYIYNALLVITQKYRLRQTDLNELMYANPFIPDHRMHQFRDGLWNGICGKPSEAVYTLIPQLENALRDTLRKTGYITVKIDSDGIQQEKYLNDFIYEKEFADFFGEDLAFQLQVLLVDSPGINLRNNIAHGLITDGQAFSHTFVFAWAQVFYLCVRMQQVYHAQLARARATPEEN